MSQRHQVSKAIRSTLVLWVITAFIYPLFLLISGQVVFNSLFIMHPQILS